MSQMSQDQQQRILAWINQKWHGRHCPMCDGNQWNVNDHVHEIRDFQHGNMVIGGVPIMPVVPVICANCGNTVFVNAIQSGVVDRG